MKTCKVCHVEKDASAFSGQSLKCRECTNAARRAKYATDEAFKKKLLVARRAHTRTAVDVTKRSNIRKAAKRVGCDPDEVFAYYETHDGRCDACRQEPSGARGLAVDHCHSSGKFRGFLCNSCNVAAGHLKDSPERFMALLGYIQKNAEKC